MDKKHKPLITALMGVVLMIGGLPAPAAEPSSEETFDDIDLLEMQVETVVTGLRGGKQDIKDMPYAVSVITAEDIRMSGARNIPDALRLVPGMDVAEMGYGSILAEPRGFGTSQSNLALVLVDGRQIYNSLRGGTLWMDWPFQLEDIERIEVIRGPAGVTWGAHAVNGVINIVTKDPADQLGTTVVASGGNRTTQKEHVGTAFQEGKLRMRVSGEYEGSMGYEGGSFLRALDDKYKGGRFGTYGIYEANPRDTLTFSGGSSVVDGIHNGSIYTGLKTQEPGVQTNFLAGNWNHKISKDNEFNLSAFFNDFDNDFGNKTIQYHFDQFSILLSHTFKPAEKHTITWGLDSKADLIDTGGADPYLATQDFLYFGTFGLFVQDEWRFAPKWALNVGGRIDYSCEQGFEPSARVALSYDLTKDSMIYGAISRAFHSPPPGARYADIPLLTDVPVLGDVIKVNGNPELKTLTMMGYEVGYKRHYRDRFETNLALYWHEYSDIYGLTPLAR